MEKSTKEQALEILETNRYGVMATVSNGKPHSRYMTFENEGFTLYTVTANDAEKLQEIERNPHTHILYGYEDEGMFESFLEIEGMVSVFNADAIKQKVLNRLDVGIDGTKMTLLRIHPSGIRLMNKAGDNREEVHFQ